MGIAAKALCPNRSRMTPFSLLQLQPLQQSPTSTATGGVHEAVLAFFAQSILLIVERCGILEWPWPLSLWHM